ncbi:MAG: glycosyl transferase [Myxococcales bacterium]
MTTASQLPPGEVPAIEGVRDDTSVVALGLSILIPCYNEARSIASTIAQVRETVSSLACAFEILVIDDGSRDGTAAIAQDAGVRVIAKAANEGYGAALKSGLLQARFGWIAITDADGTYPITDIARLAASTTDYDMVVGARTGEEVHIPMLRRPAKWAINQLANYLSGFRIPDLNSGLRLFRKELGQRFYSLYPDGFSFTTTITVSALTNGYRVKFVPINYFKRVGSSSIHPIKDTIGFTILVVRLATWFKPLNVFIPPAFLLFTVGLAKALVDLARTNAFGVGSSLIMLVGVQIGFMGLLADLVLRRTKL